MSVILAFFCSRFVAVVVVATAVIIVIICPGDADTLPPSFSEAETFDVRVANGSCSDYANGRTESRACVQRPLCGILDCDDFWTPWSSCDKVCVGGQKTRTFSRMAAVTGSNAVSLEGFSDEFLDTFARMACGQRFNVTQNASCEVGYQGE
mgnify:CR=1 FL=1